MQVANATRLWAAVSSYTRARAQSWGVVVEICPLHCLKWESHRKRGMFSVCLWLIPDCTLAAGAGPIPIQGQKYYILRTAQRTHVCARFVLFTYFRNISWIWQMPKCLSAWTCAKEHARSQSGHKKSRNPPRKRHNYHVALLTLPLLCGWLDGHEHEDIACVSEYVITYLFIFCVFFWHETDVLWMLWMTHPGAIRHSMMGWEWCRKYPVKEKSLLNCLMRRGSVVFCSG